MDARTERIIADLIAYHAAHPPVVVPMYEVVYADPDSLCGCDEECEH